LGQAQKFYLTLVKGAWRDAKRAVTLPLHKYVLQTGERRVRVESDGREARTIFRAKRAFPGFTLLEAELKTGRTHQIRVHVAHLGFPIAGDDKYGDFELNRTLARQGLKRMFLHACRMTVNHPTSGRPITFDAPLSEDLERFLHALQLERLT